MKPINYKALGAKIKEYRKKENITQEQLAEMADISLSHMSNVETASVSVSLPALKPMWRNWQTRCVQVAVSLRSCEFESRHRHTEVCDFGFFISYNNYKKESSDSFFLSTL